MALKKGLDSSKYFPFSYFEEQHQGKQQKLPGICIYNNQ